MKIRKHAATTPPDTKGENNLSRFRHSRHDERRRDRMARDGASHRACTSCGRAQGKGLIALLSRLTQGPPRAAA
jgi:hypothetical protein